MRNTNMRKGFTMIELIFVIVIIGILAAVAIPKLAANKDDATASTCLHEVGQLQGEISQAYAAAKDFKEWSLSTYIDTNITNITTTVTEGNGIGTVGHTLAHGTGITYICDSELLATITPSLPAGTSNYIMTTLISEAGTSPANIKAAASLKKKQNGDVTKVYRF